MVPVSGFCRMSPPHRAGLSPRPPFRCLQCLQVLPNPDLHGRVVFAIHSVLDFFAAGQVCDFCHDFRFVILFVHRFAFQCGLCCCYVLSIHTVSALSILSTQFF